MSLTEEQINAQIMTKAGQAVVAKDPETASYYRGLVMGLALAYISAGLIDWDAYDEYCMMVYGI
ncbi:MAG: hypothetical protein M0Z41_10755 [Peptococcaceae bacterium]|jgi:hypothetical protein|nr:hypothetical protein [Peptococcaceae bacterium]